MDSIFNQRYRTSFLKEIFQTKNKEYTTTSKYYQLILRTFLEDSEKKFKVREVANNIIDELPKRSKGEKADENGKDTKPKSHAVENIEKTLRNYFDNLESWKLLNSQNIPVEKGTGTTKGFQLTDIGRLLALFVDMEYNDYNDKSYNIFYSFLERNFFKDQSFSVDDFCSLYLKYIQEIGLFSQFMKDFRDFIVYSNTDIYDIYDFFTNIITFRFLNKKLNKKLWKVWDKSFSQLSLDNMKLLQHHLKINLERKIRKQVHEFHEYEKVRYKNRENFHLVVEIWCTNCAKNNIYRYLYASIPMIYVYLPALFYNKKILSSHYFKNSRCSVCQRSKFDFIVV